MSHIEINPEPDSRTRPTTAVIEAIAEHEGLDPLDLDQPLYEVIDTDALDSIIGEGKDGLSEVTVQFSYNGCRVHATSDGSVEVNPRPE
jgi:hypothetical protein